MLLGTFPPQLSVLSILIFLRTVHVRVIHIQFNIHSLILQRFIKLLEDPRYGSEYWEHHRENVLQSRLIGIYFLMGKASIQ